MGGATLLLLFNQPSSSSQGVTFYFAPEWNDWFNDPDAAGIAADLQTAIIAKWKSIGSTLGIGSHVFWDAAEKNTNSILPYVVVSDAKAGGFNWNTSKDYDAFSLYRFNVYAATELQASTIIKAACVAFNRCSLSFTGGYLMDFRQQMPAFTHRMSASAPGDQTVWAASVSFLATFGGSLN